MRVLQDFRNTHNPKISTKAVIENLFQHLLWIFEVSVSSKASVGKVLKHLHLTFKVWKYLYKETKAHNMVVFQHIR